MASRKPRRSQQWFGRGGKMGFIYRSWVKNRGIPHDQFDGRPVIGICNTYSELTPCNSHFRTLAEHVKAVSGKRRLSARIPRDVAGRDAAQADGDALPQPREHGRRGSIRGNPIDWCRATDGLRQDHAVADHGRLQRRPADDRRLGRSDALRLV
jgi:dihydroxy-acid dehydratase